MEAVETQAAPSTAVETPLEIPRSNTPEYTEWRTSGKLPEKKTEAPANADTAPADKPKEASSEIAPPPEAEKQQASKRQPEIEARFKKLTDEIKRLSGELEETRKPKESKAESTPAPRNYQEWKASFSPSKWIEQYTAQNPSASYEDAVDAMSEFKADAREYFRSAETKQRELVEKFQKDLADVQGRYEDFESIQASTMDAIMAPEVPEYIRDMFRDSEVQMDLVYVIGENAEELDKFAKLVKTSPSKAARYVTRIEDGILSKRSAKPNAEVETPRNESGQFTPAKRGPESAAPPPIEIGSRGGAVTDESEHALKAGDFRAFKEAEDRKEIARRRGK